MTKKEIKEGMEKWIPLLAVERAGFKVLTIPKLMEMLNKKPDNGVIIHFDWHGSNNEGPIMFPIDIKIQDLSSYKIVINHTLGSIPNVEDTEGMKMIEFKIEGLPRFSKAFLGDEKPKKVAPLPPHMTVKDLKNKLSGLDDRSFFVVDYRGKYVSPDLLMNYNIDTYKIQDKKGIIYGSELKTGEVFSFGLGTTMSTEYGDFTFTLEPKKITESKKYLKNIIIEHLNNFKK